MLPSTPDDLIDFLVRLKLLRPGEVPRDIQASLGPLTMSEALALLERKQILTSLQVEKLKKGDTHGLVLGDYKLLYRNASGSFARVYRAASVKDGKMVGLKLLRERWAADREIVQLFHREGEIGQKLIHPNIVPVYDCITYEKYHFITMEFVEGGNLKNFLKIRGKLTPLEAAKFTLDMARGLDYALSKGYTHRDLKPTNVLMSSTGVAKLIDFGLAAEDNVFARVGGEEMQTALEYATLEKNTNAPKNDTRSDLFFLGGILFELLSGKPPYAPTKDRDERKRFGRYRDVPPVTALEPKLPFKIAAVVDKLMHTNPNERYQTPGELAFEMEMIVKDLGGTVAPVETPKPVEVPKPAAAPEPPPTAKIEEPAKKGSLPRVLCIEDRPKHQDVLRDYFERHDLRLALASDLECAVYSINHWPPDCTVLMGDSVGAELETDGARLREINRIRDMSFVIVLSECQAKLKSQLKADLPGVIILVQPITLRDLRKQLATVLATGPA